MEVYAMAVKTTQISANISSETKLRMEQYVQQYGVKKAYLVESALQHHLNALEAIPQDVIIPPVLLVSRVTGEEIIDRIENPLPPTAAMRTLMND